MVQHISKITFPMILLFLFFIAVLHYIGHLFPSHWLNSMHHTSIVSEYIKTAIELTVIIIGFIKRRDIYQWFIRKFRSKEFASTGDEFPVAEKRVIGVVIPISRIEQPEWIIRHLKPKYVRLLYTSSNQSREAAIQLVQKFNQEVSFNLTEEDINNGKDMITDPYDPAQTKRLARKAIKDMLALGLKNENIFVDTTGGTVPMSIGAFQAAEEEGVSTIYIVGKGEKGLIKDPTNREHGFPIFISEKRQI